MNIVLRELRAHLKSIIIWCVSMVLLIYTGMIKYSGIEQSGDAINDMLAGLPDALLTAFGMNQFDLTQIGGYYGIFFLYFVLIGTIHAVMLGATIISKEERDHTADFLFVKPVKRNKIITAKMIAGLINIIILNITTLISSIIFVNIYNKGESITGDIFMLMLALLILQLLFYSIGAFTSTVTNNTRSATSISTGILLGTFILSIAIDMYDKLDFLKFITPFKYFEAKDIMFGGKINGIFVILSFTIIIVATIYTYKGYQRRDLKV